MKEVEAGNVEYLCIKDMSRMGRDYLKVGQIMEILLEMINASEAREDDETFKNPVDVMFDELEARDPDHFAVKQYRKYKLAAGDICSK